MSVYLTFDESAGEQVASNLGWTDFGNWVDDLDVGQFPHVVSLWEHGYTNEISKLIAELKIAIEQSEPTAKGLAKTIDQLIEMLHFEKNQEVVFINDGMGSGGGIENKNKPIPPQIRIK